MLDLNRVRADFAAYLAANAATRHSLDAALMHVVERAYQQGMLDGAETEREECARLCEKVIQYPPGYGGGWEGYGPVRTPRGGLECAAAIRERSGS